MGTSSIDLLHDKYTCWKEQYMILSNRPTLCRDVPDEPKAGEAIGASIDVKTDSCMITVRQESLAL